jgi:short-subunit dehydrogenase
VEIRGKRVLLTGATGGLGRAIAEAMAADGATMVLSSRKRDELEALASALPGDGHTTIVADLADEGAAVKLASEAGEVDVLVANAALAGTGTIESFSSGEIERAIRVNLDAPILMAQALLPAMKARGAGHVVFISSLSGKVASPRGSIYNATKFGLRGFSLALREDQIVDGTGIGVSLVLPGFIRDAGMFADGGADLPPGAGTATPEDVGAAVIKAVTRNKAEIVVAPPQMRALSAFAHVFPQIAGRSQRGVGRKVGDQLAKGNADKR